MRRSTGRLYAFCAVVFAFGLVASGYLNFVQFQRNQDNQQLAQSTISQLKSHTSQVGSTSATPDPSNAAAVLGAQIVKISELGVTVATLNPLSDLTYQFQEQNGLDGVNLTSTSLINTTTNCGPGALGRLTRQLTTDRQSFSSSNLVKQIGLYNFYYVPSKTTCAKDPVTTAALKADNAILPAVLATLTLSS